MKKSDLKQLIKEEVKNSKPRYVKEMEKEIMEAWTFLRKNNNTIPSDTLDFIRDASLEKLKLISQYSKF